MVQKRFPICPSISKLAFTVLVLVITTNTQAQEAIDSLSTEKEILVGYGLQQKQAITSSIYSIDQQQFNKGNINDPALLIRSKVPGLGVYKKGSDPNGRTTLRVRGITSIESGNEPLIIINGMIAASLDNVDPNDIATFTILKDGSAAAIYGIRASSGAIIITTKTGQRGSEATASYTGYLAVANLTNPLPSMSPDEYIASGGNDLGSETDWLKEVSQTGFSHVDNLSVAGGSNNTIYRFSANLRAVNGILKKSGFDQINARANISHFTLNDRLKLNFNMSLTNRESNFSYREGFRYATVHNPTAPITFDNGNYAQAILFDNFNPVAIIKQNQNVGKQKLLSFYLRGEYEILSDLSIGLNYGRQNVNNLYGEFYPSTSFFRGISRGGLASRSFDDRELEQFEVFAKYNLDKERIKLSAIMGYSYQDNFQESLALSLGNLASNDIGFYGIDQSADRVLGGVNNVYVDASASPIEKVVGFFGRFNFSINNGIFLNTTLRSESSTRLGGNNRWGTFSSIGAGVDLDHYLDLGWFSQLKLRIGHGTTGNLPITYGMAQDEYAYNLNSGGVVTFERAGNPDLKWEQKTETNIGLDFGIKNDRITGSLDIYSRNMSDLILEARVDESDFSLGTQFKNASQLLVKGGELSLTADIFSNKAISFLSTVVLSGYSTWLKNYTGDQESRSHLGGPGQGSSSFIRVADGEELGQLWGPLFDGVGQYGLPIFKDANGDGILKIDPGQALDEDTDFKMLGSGFPSLELGWSNQVTYKNFDFNAFFRGAFGHSLVNTYRVFYEPIDLGAINSYNRVITNKAVDGLSSSQFSSLYVEKANFLRLDNVSLGYTFKTEKGAAFKKIRLFGIVQNAFTLTSYTGVDPDVSIQDFGSTDNGGYSQNIADPLSPGIDRRNIYYTARALVFGVNFGF